MHFPSIIGCLIIVLFSFSENVSSQELNHLDFVITQFGMEEGLPQSSVNDIIQTKDGYIWLATFGGLVRFDGFNFTIFDRFNSERMRSDRVLHLYESVDGSIWLSTEDGFIRYFKGVFTSFIFQENDSQIFSPLIVNEDSSGQLWVSTNRNIYKFENDEFYKVKVSVNEDMTNIARNDTTGSLLVFDRQVFKTLGDSVYKIIDLDSEIKNNAIAVIEYPKNSAQFFIATNGDGVLRFQNQKLTKHSLSEFSPFNEIWNFSIDNNNQLWILGYGGQGIWNGTNIESIELPDEIGNLEFNTIIEDKEGNLWFGSASDGLFKLQPSRVKNIDGDEGLENQQMLSLLEMKNGNFLFSTNCGGVFEWDGELVRVPPISEYLTNKCNWSVFEDSKGRFWFGSRVLYRTNSINEPGIEIDSAYGFNGIDIFAITEDSNNNIWIGAINGLYKYDGYNYQRYSTNDGLSYNDVRTIYEDNKGAIWIGTTAGLNKLEDEKITTIFLKDQKEEVQEPYIRAIHQDELGTMWFGTYGNGIFRLKDGLISNITAENGLFDNVVSHLVEDENGYFWMGSNRGISSVSKRELNLFFDASLPYVSAFSYGLNDGMNTIETNGGFQPSVIHSNSNYIYFPTVSGVAIVSTDEIDPSSSKPPVYIEQVRTSTEIFQYTDSVTLPFNDAFLEVRFTALNFRNPEQLQFRYMLKGLNENWIDIEDQRRLLFTKIPPGEYELKIVASNSNQNWSNEATLSIIVVPPFWQTTWFYSLAVLFFLTVGPFIYLVRIRRLRKQNELQRKFTEQLIEHQENERRRIASELHDSLGQQILVIKNRAELAKAFYNQPEELKEELNEIIESAMTSITDVRSISHGLRPVHLENFGLTESLRHLLREIEQTSNFELSFFLQDIDGAIPQDSEINFYRIIQEAVNNIIKHANASEASITVQKNDTRIEVKIWDDGIGFNPNDIEKTSGIGFLGMRERVETLGGNISIKSNTLQGTTIQINIPT